MNLKTKTNIDGIDILVRLYSNPRATKAHENRKYLQAF